MSMSLEDRLNWLLEGRTFSCEQDETWEREGFRAHSFVTAADPAAGPRTACLSLQIYEGDVRLNTDAARLIAMAPEDAVPRQSYFHLSDVGVRGEPVFWNVRRRLPYRLSAAPSEHGTTFDRLHQVSGSQGVVAAASSAPAPPPAIVTPHVAVLGRVEQARRFEAARERSFHEFRTWDMATLEQVGTLQVAGSSDNAIFLRYSSPETNAKLIVTITDPDGRVLLRLPLSGNRETPLPRFPAPRGFTIVWQAVD